MSGLAQGLTSRRSSHELAQGQSQTRAVQQAILLEHLTARLFGRLYIVTTASVLSRTFFYLFSSCTSRSRSLAENQRLRRQHLAHIASSSGATVAVRGKLRLIGGSA
jgi:hypothetical protein